jgi:hypothetical protein
MNMSTAIDLRTQDALDRDGDRDGVVALGGDDRARNENAPAAAPRGELAEYLGDVRAWVSALLRTAAAREAAALTPRGERAAAALEAARAEERDATDRLERWRGRGVPHVEVARELGLSPMATAVLLIAAAPQIWGEISRAYGARALGPARPIVDELLLAHLLEADDAAARAMIARELDAGAPLVRTGAIEIGPGPRPYAALRVDPAIAHRRAGTPAAPAGPAETGRRGSRSVYARRASPAPAGRRALLTGP